MSRIFHDITRPLDASVAPWPGDTPFSFRDVWQMSEGSSVNVGSFTASTHFSTHVDAPWHYSATGARIDELPLELFFGESVVLDCRGAAEMTVEFLAGKKLAARVLFRTDAWLDSAVFPKTYPLLHADVPAWLAQQGVRLIGLDVPSADPEDSRELPIHHALANAGITILESLCLREIAAGVYDLATFPLRLTGADAAPVRAVLIENL